MAQMSFLKKLPHFDLPAYSSIYNYFRDQQFSYIWVLNEVPYFLFAPSTQYARTVLGRPWKFRVMETSFFLEVESGEMGGEGGVCGDRLKKG